MYWFYYIIGKDPNHPKLQETQIKRIKRLAKENKLYYEVDKIGDDVHIYVRTDEQTKVPTLKLVFPQANNQYDDFSTQPLAGESDSIDGQ